MLPYILAIAVALASFILFIGAFTFPKLHRQDDFLWSGIGLFYALVLWVCAGRLTGGVLLGQVAATFLLLAFGWQTLKLRRAIAYPGSQTDLEGFSLTRWLGSFGKTSRKPAASPKTPAAPTQAAAAVTEVAPEIPETAPETPEIAPETPETAPEAVTAAPELARETVIELEEAIPEIIEEAAQAIEEETAAETEPATQEKPGFFRNLFGSRQEKPEAKPTSLTTALDEIETEAELEEFEEDWEPDETLETPPIPENIESPSEESEAATTVAETESDAAINEVGSEEETEANIEEFGEDWQTEQPSEINLIPKNAESANPESVLGESETENQ